MAPASDRTQQLNVGFVDPGVGITRSPLSRGLPLVHRAHHERVPRVDLTRSLHRLATTALCAFLPFLGPNGNACFGSRNYGDSDKGLAPLSLCESR
jgi:hypothetical protein